jgi:hypothetical protein
MLGGLLGADNIHALQDWTKKKFMGREQEVDKFFEEVTEQCLARGDTWTAERPMGIESFTA